MALLFAGGDKAPGKQYIEKLSLKVVIAVKLLLIAVMSLAVIYSRIEEEDLVVEILVMGEWFVNSSFSSSTGFGRKDDSAGTCIDVFFSSYLNFKKSMLK